MPSCSSKFSIQRGYELSDFIENSEYYESGIVHFFFSLYLSCSSQTVNDLKVSWCCVKTNIFSVQLSGSLKILQTFEHYALDSSVYKSSHRLSIFILDLLKSKGEQIAKSTLHQRDKVIDQTHFNHNVIFLNIIYCCLRLLLFYTYSYKNNCISYGNIINSVMEVDETVEGVNSHMGNLPNGNEINAKSPSDPIIINSECDHSTVINDNQIMNKFDFSQINNSVMHSNSIDAKVREDKIDTVFNGDIKNCIINLCDESTVDLCNDSTIDLEDDSQTETKLIVKNDEQANGVADNVKLDNSESCELKENKPNDIISEPKVEDVEKEKPSESTPNDTSLDKSKCKDKNDSTSVNHVSSSSLSSSSSSSSKKHESQSRSHQSSSSSSSRHKYRDSRDDRHKSSSSSSRSNEVSSSRRSEDKSKSDSKSRSRSCHHKPDEKCHCKSRHHESHHHSKKSKKYQSVKTQCSSQEIAYELRQNKTEEVNPYFTRVPWVPHPQIANLKYGRFYRIEVDRNGGASVCHLYMDEISHLSEEQMKECAIDFIKLSYSEDENECAYHVMGIVHGAAAYLPDLVDYMADHYPTLTVKTTSLVSRDNHTTTMSQYRDEVYKTYCNGTFRYAPLDQLSICGVLGEEVGAYFPDFVARLEQSPFMKPVMPWSFLSIVQTDNPRESNDGPIFWVRPGEQMLPANEALKESARPKKRRNNELDNLAYIAGSRSSEARESLFMDRTKAHADQVGVDYGISNTAPTAAVGVLKAVNCGHPEHGNRATKDVVAFHAQDYSELLEILMLDLYEPPQTQCTKWIEVSKLNTMRREGIRYAHIQLHDNDVYYLPRKIIHQFQTISSVASVAWHIRYREYFSAHGAPNLHTPTGINKGQVFYEKKNVAVYCPPLSENELLAVANGESGLKTPKKSDRLREYSPFKHSPRKLHKHQPPRTAPKKDKDPVPLPPPPPRPQTNSVKKESEEGSGDSDRKSSSSSSSSSLKKRERSKSAERRSSTDRGTKREHDSESRKTSEKSESSHSRRSSGEHTPSKKEHRSQDSHSSHHRKEVKNLDSEFSSKKDKSSHERSPKSKHERKRSSDESRHEGTSKHRRHEDSSKSRRSSSSSGKHEKSREHGSSSSSSSVSNGDSSHKVKTEDKKDGEREANLKRKHGDSPNRSPAKKIKEENPDPGVVENGRKSPERETSSESQSRDKSQANGLSVKQETSLTDENECINVNKCSESSETFDENGSDEREASADVTNKETNSSQKEVNDIDLRNNASLSGFNSQVPSPTAQPTVNSPPGSKAVAVATAAANTDSSTPTNSLPDSTTFVQANSHHPENALSSRDKTGGDVQLKKLKKKVVQKKESESYDLLGDIMSQMDKNK